jgi:hypothetical protein
MLANGEQKILEEKEKKKNCLNVWQLLIKNKLNV